MLGGEVISAKKHPFYFLFKMPEQRLSEAVKSRSSASPRR